MRYIDCTGLLTSLAGRPAKLTTPERVMNTPQASEYRQLHRNTTGSLNACILRSSKFVLLRVIVQRSQAACEVQAHGDRGPTEPPSPSGVNVIRIQRILDFNNKATEYSQQLPLGHLCNARSLASMTTPWAVESMLRALGRHSCMKAHDGPCSMLKHLHEHSLRALQRRSLQHRIQRQRSHETIEPLHLQRFGGSKHEHGFQRFSAQRGRSSASRWKSNARHLLVGKT